MYQIELISCITERDNWNNGCYGKMINKTFDLSFRAESKEEVLKEASEFIGANELEYDEYNNSYRMDRFENDQGLEPTKQEMNNFKKGKIDLWNVCYEFQIYKMELVTENN